jgi:hypothetical protein
MMLNLGQGQLHRFILIITTAPILKYFLILKVICYFPITPMEFIWFYKNYGTGKVVPVLN